MHTYRHIPVLLNEVLDALQPAAGKVIIDGTLGGGGHARALLERLQPDGRLLAIDADPAALAAWSDRAIHRETCILQHGWFGDIANLAKNHGLLAVDGILLDLGVSSHQLETAERGFSFTTDGPLDMRFDPTHGPSAAELLARMSEQELADIIFRYGEERFARRIARRIVAMREKTPIVTTRQLADLVERTIRSSTSAPQRIHPATRTFQALRIAVNRELEQLEQALPQAVSLLRPGGRLAVISFHSLEDRFVKRFFQEASGCGGETIADHLPRLRLITKKPIRPTPQELRANPRSRSAKLRVAERIGIACPQ